MLSKSVWLRAGVVLTVSALYCDIASTQTLKKGPVTVDLWKKQSMQASVTVYSAHIAPPGVLIVSYALGLLRLEGSTPELTQVNLLAVCNQRNNIPLEVSRHSTVFLKFVGGQFVKDKEKVDPEPVEIPFEENNEFGKLPATTACSVGAAMLVAK